MDATILAGGALTVWIIAEVAMMRSFHVLHGIYGGIGLSLLALGVRTGWRSHSPRHRWVILAALAGTVGYFAPACTGVLSTRASLDEVSQAALLVVAGLVEGLALGIGQAWAFPLPVRRVFDRVAPLDPLGRRPPQSTSFWHTAGECA